MGGGAGGLIERHASWFFVLPAFIFLAGVVAFPVVWTAALSLTAWSASATQPPVWVGAANYLQIAGGDAAFRNALWVTLYFTGVSVAVEAGLGVGLAQLVNREFVGKGVARTLLLLPVAGTPVALALVWRHMYNPSNGVFNWLLELVGLPPLRWLSDVTTALPALILFDVWQWTPLVMLITLAAMVALPGDPYEAARIDGAGAWQLFWHLTLPMVRPAVAAAVMLRLIDSLKTFDQLYITTQGGPGIATQTLTLYVFDQAFRYLNFGYASALLLVLFTLILAGNVVLLALRRAGA